MPDRAAGRRVGRGVGGEVSAVDRIVPERLPPRLVVGRGLRQARGEAMSPWNGS